VGETGTQQWLFANWKNRVDSLCKDPSARFEKHTEPQSPGKEEEFFMGKGDRRTKRGKLFRKSYGVKRPRKKKTKTEQKK
jgi:30S ribosomal protein S31